MKLKSILYSVIRLSSLLTVGCLLITNTAAQQATKHAHNADRSTLRAMSTNLWWKNAVLYEIYPRSFQDSNGDGIGDLKGITSRLDYLKSLGVDAIWLTPIYPSPQVDFGYDISNYEAIDPQYGTMEDFDKLLAEAKKRHIRILMDMVLNHTSDQHKWFKESASSRTNPKRDWYIWRDGKGRGQPPNNWQSDFGHSAWKYDGTTGQWYYHEFYPQQPDLNWRNPEVKKAMYSTLRFWLDKGVAGFRLDAITNLFEDQNLTDEKLLPGTNEFGDPNQDDSKTNNLPEVHDVLRDLRKVVDSYPGDRVLVGETYLPSVQELAKMYGAKHDELQLPMDMQFGFNHKLDVKIFRTAIDEAETKVNGNEPLIVLDNHDNERSWDRFGDGVHNEAIARMLSAVLLATRSTVLLYYGEELGMVTTPPARKEDVKDPIGIIGWPKEKGRDGERTPMQWDGTRLGGFTTGKPWLPVPASVATVNVATQQKDPDSMLAWFKELIALRRSNPAVGNGSNTMLNHDSENTLVWLRHSGSETVIVLANFGAEAKTISVADDLKANGLAASSLMVLLKSDKSGARTIDPARVALPGFGVVIADVK